MWKEIERYFSKYPAQKKVALFLLSKGFQIREDGKVVCESIEIPHTQIARELGIDRRVVDSTAMKILQNEELKEIYGNLHSIAFLKDVAPHLGLGVVIISPEDASKTGIIGKVTGKIAEHGISIRQAIADDPYLTADPVLTIVTDRGITGALVEDLKAIDGIKEITIL